MRNKLFVSAPLVRIAVSLMAGIIVGIKLPLPYFPLLTATLVIALALWKYELLQSAAICLCFIVLGALLADRQQKDLQVEWPAGEIRYEAVVISSPVEKPRSIAVDILLPESGRKLKCYLQKDHRSRRLQVGDGLRLQSVIRPNRDWHIGTFNYRRYLEIHGFTGSTYVAGWKWQKAVVSLRPLPRTERTRLYFLKLRSRLLERLTDSGIEGEAYEVVAAMALGDKTALTQEVRELYAVTGASHVLALSGLHLGIIYMLLSWLIIGRRWQTVSQLTILVSIWAFVFLVGMPTSVVRSAIMLSFYILMALGHRDKMSVNTLAFAAILLLAFNPLALFDIGFQMSFLAVFSILTVIPLTERLIQPEFLMRHRIVKWLWGIISVSCAAQIGVAPLIAYYFGRFSTYFLLTNLVVIPAATLILYLSIAVLTVPSLAYLLSKTIGLLHAALKYLSSLPGANIEGLHPTVLQVAMTYVIIASVWLILAVLPPNGPHRR